jgi:hypothetical protein
MKTMERFSNGWLTIRMLGIKGERSDLTPEQVRELAKYVKELK